MVDHIVKPDLVAPGNRVISLLAQHGTLALNNPENIVTLATYQQGAPRAGEIPVQPSYDPASNQQPPAVKIGAGYSKQYYSMNGTSMAAGVVSGAVADLLQAAPSLTPDQVKMLLMQTASKTFPTVSTVVEQTTGEMFTSFYDVFTIGAGYLDLEAAIANLSKVKQVPASINALSPTATYDATSGDVNLTFDASSVFSDRAMWGATANEANRAMWGASGVWSSSVLIGSRAMWGAGSTWGASSNDANRAMWGASAIWTNRAMWGATAKNASESTLVKGEQ